MVEMGGYSYSSSSLYICIFYYYFFFVIIKESHSRSFTLCFLDGNKLKLPCSPKPFPLQYSLEYTTESLEIQILKEMSVDSCREKCSPSFKVRHHHDQKKRG